MTMKVKIGFAAGALLLLVLLIPAAGYLASFRLEPEPLPASAELLPSAEPELGGAVTARLQWTLPLHLRPGRVVVTPPPEVVAAGAPTVECSAWRWDRAVWTVRAELRPLRPGVTADGKLSVELPGGAGSARQASAVIPPLNVRPLADAGGDLTLAAALADRGPVSRAWLWWLIPAVVMVALAIRYFRRRKAAEAPPAPPWLRAAAALAELRDSVRGRRIPLESAFVRLTDLMRGYLEERYRIPASARTTDEFLDSLNAPDTPLPPDERPFLRDFLEAADLVKFARQTPDETRLLNAVSGAEKLVEHTTPTVADERGEVKEVRDV